MKNYALKLRPNAQIRRECDHVEAISKKTLLFIEAKATSLPLSPPTATQNCYRTKPPTLEIPCLKLSNIQSLNCLYYRLAARMFYNSGQFHLTYLPLTTCLKLVMDGRYGKRNVLTSPKLTTQQQLMGHCAHCRTETDWPNANYNIASWFNWRSGP